MDKAAGAEPLKSFSDKSTNVKDRMFVKSGTPDKPVSLKSKTSAPVLRPAGQERSELPPKRNSRRPVMEVTSNDPNVNSFPDKFKLVKPSPNAPSGTAPDNRLPLKSKLANSVKRPIATGTEPDSWYNSASGTKRSTVSYPERLSRSSKSEVICCHEPPGGGGGISTIKYLYRLSLGSSQQYRPGSSRQGIHLLSMFFPVSKWNVGVRAGCRFKPVTRREPPTISTVTPGQDRTSLLSKKLRGICPSLKGREAGVFHWASLVSPQARRTCDSSTGPVSSSSVGRSSLAARLVKWLRMSTKAKQSAISPVLAASST